MKYIKIAVQIFIWTTWCVLLSPIFAFISLMDAITEGNYSSAIEKFIAQYKGER